MSQLSFDRYKKAPQAIKAGLWFTICNFIQRGIQFLVVPLYTRLLTTEGYGCYSVFLAWMNIITIFATLNMSGGIYYNGVMRYEGEEPQYTSSVLTLGSLSTVLVFVLASFLYPIISSYIGLSYNVFLLMFVAIFFNQALMIWTANQRINYKYKSLIVITILVSLLSPLFGLFFVLKYNMGYEGLVYGLVLSYFFVCGWLLITILYKGKCFLQREYWKYSLKLSFPLLPHYLSMIILGQMSRIMVQYYCGASLAGIFSLAYQVSLIMNLLISGINSALTPWLYHNLKEQKYDEIKRVTITLILCVGFISVFAMLIAPEIILILGGYNYMEAIWIIPPVLLSTLLTFIYSIYGTVLFYYEKTEWVAISTSSGAVLNILLNIILIPKCGYIAAGYVTLVSYFLLYIMYRYFSSKVCNQKSIDFWNLFDLRQILHIILVVAVISCFVLGLYLVGFICRILTIGSLFCILYKYKDNYLMILRKIKI